MPVSYVMWDPVMVASQNTDRSILEVFLIFPEKHKTVEASFSLFLFWRYFWASMNSTATIPTLPPLWHTWVTAAKLLSYYTGFLYEHHSHFQKEDNLSINRWFKQALLEGKVASSHKSRGRHGMISPFSLGPVIMMRRNISIHYKNDFN